eukprot:gene7783-9132_t
MDQVKKRVKVYQLDVSGKWEDKGTGHVSCSFIETYGAQGLVVRSEEDKSTILEAPLSFQEPIGCQEVWDYITLYRRKEGDMEMIELPEPILANLEAIKDLVEPSLTISTKEKIGNTISKDNYLKTLLDLFDELEKINDMSGLHLLFHIFRNLILFNDSNVLELLLSEDYLMRVMGVLEYDPEISNQNRIKHRDFLRHHVIFKQVVKFSTDALITTIHQTFRVQYLKDVVLPRVLDDLTFSTLNSIIYFNNAEIVGQIQRDTDFLQSMYVILPSPSKLK